MEEDKNSLYDAEKLIDSMIVDCNELPKALCSGEYVKFCSLIIQMVQRLSLLKDGIKNDMESLQEQVKELTKNQGQGGDENVMEH